MYVISILGALAVWATASATGVVTKDKACGLQMFGKSSAYILEVKAPAGGLSLSDVVAAVSPYGLNVDRGGEFAHLLEDTVLIPAARLDNTTRPFPDNAALARLGITVYPDPRPWSPGVRSSLAPLRLAQVKSYGELSECEVTIPAGVGLAEARSQLHAAGALFVRGEPTSTVGTPWDATVLMSPTTLCTLGLAAAGVGTYSTESRSTLDD